MKLTPLALLLLTACAFVAPVNAQTLDLDGQWRLESDALTESIAAKVPGYIHEALLTAGHIADLNDEGIQTWSRHDYAYVFEGFGLPAGWSPSGASVLVLEGVDTFAEVWLNGTKLGGCNNYFRTWRLPIEAGVLQADGNRLEVRLRSPFAAGEALLKKQAHPLPGEPIRAVARKPQYHYGWDWGPKITPMGIHGSVYLEPADLTRFEGEELRTVSIENGQQAMLDVNAIVNSGYTGKVTLEITIADAERKRSFAREAIVSKGQRTELNHRFELDSIKLWWPHDLGLPHLYNVELRLLDSTEAELARSAFKVGIRTVELDTSPDDEGAHFRFVINGKQHFMRGANLIPAGIFERSLSDEKVIQNLEAARAVHMNMLRIWGGGVYERDTVYAWCDANGVLVWQDFMYACAMYPGDDDFIANATQEAIEQVLRLRKHPSIALWCGNNENSEGWHRWGWQSGLSDSEKTAVWRSYRVLFKEVLPAVVHGFHNIHYWESSPSLGRGDALHTTRGDAHYWGVWHDAEPFSTFNQKVPRFMSEFGFQSMPDIETIEAVWESGSADTSAAAVRGYQKHPRGFKLMNDYMLRSYSPASSSHDWAYQTQLVQRDGIVMGIRAHRMGKPRCMGTLYWQLNDCWPGISWSSIDGAGRWKALHYALKQAYAPVSVWLEHKDGKVRMCAVNDLGTPVTLPFTLRFLGMDGENITRPMPYSLTVDDSPIEQQIDIHDVQFAKLYANGAAFFVLEYPFRGEVYRQVLFAREPLAMEFGSASPEMTIRKAPNGTYTIAVETSVFAKDVVLGASAEGAFSQNYIDILPKERLSITFTPNSAETDVKFSLRCLNCD